MKKYLFIYSHSKTYICWNHLSFEDRHHEEEVTFPNKVSDWEVIDKAKEFGQKAKELGEAAIEKVSGNTSEPNSQK